MGSKEVNVTSLVRKKTLHLNAKKPKVESLKVIVKKMRRDQRVVFKGKYGNLLELLQIEVQEQAITALAQFYDHRLKCFTFQDFQLAPTLEEFGLILGYPLKDGQQPYLSLGHTLSIEAIANVLKVSEKDLREHQKKHLEKGLIQREYLEDRLRCLIEKEEWATFMDVLALTIYGVVLFPTNHDSTFVDMAAINVFIAYITRGENPMTAVLADVYYTMHFCHTERGKRILCCLPALYVWLTTHAFTRSYKATDPIDDLQTYQLETKNGGEWAQILTNLNERTVRWYPKYQEVETVIYQCGSFPNVPLIGTKGCVSYNPCLALRQLGFSIIEPPTEPIFDSLFNIYEKDKSWVPKVRRAWASGMIRKGKKELGKRCCDANEVYTQWVKDRVKNNGLPFLVASSSHDEALIVPPSDDTEEVKELKEALARSEMETEKLRMENEKMRMELVEEKSKDLQMMKAIESANKRADEEKKCKLRTQSCLRASDTALKRNREQKNKAQAKVFHLKESLRRSEASRQNLKEQLENIQREEMQKEVKD